MKDRPFLPLAVLALLCTPIAGADVPDADGVCDGDEPANVQCEVIAGPASVTVKSVVSVGIGFCQTETTDIPLQCEGSAGDLSGVGAATFGDATWVGDRNIDINAVNDQQTCTAATSPPCGFTVDICNDRDQDSTCTNIGDQDDELPDTAASQGALGTCKDDDKACADPNEAGWEGCMNDSVFGDWSDEQIIVFIGIEAGPSVTPPDVQAAVSVGTYTVWMTDNGSTICSTDDVEASSGCTWERGPADGLGGTEYCDDDGGNPINFVCDSSHAFLVVLHAGSGSTSAVANSCSGQNPQTASGTSSPNIQVATGPGTFECVFTWAVAGSGACILDDGGATNDPPEAAPECSDGIDNDDPEDPIADYPWDPGCDDPSDDDETDTGLPFPECADHFDNDANGPMDWPSDPGCSSPADDDEWSPECSNLKDDDGNGVLDGNDPGCSGAADDDESSPQCSNLMDDDGDGVFDGNDPGCSGAADDDEADPVACGASSVQVEGTPSTHGATYDATVVIRFTLGAGRTLTTESVTQTGGPSGGYWYHTHPGGQHVWETHGPDYQTRQFTYSFETSCPAGSTESFGGSYWQWN